MVKRSRLAKVKKKEKMSDLALEFKVIQEQIKDSSGEVRQGLERRRDRVVSKYKKMCDLK
jgi:GH24 family phage-related lysozyme (muramidase)